MPVTLRQVVDHVIAMDDPETARTSSLAGAVRETIAALGLEVSKTGEVYNPAPEPRVVIASDNWRQAGRRRR